MPNGFGNTSPTSFTLWSVPSTTITDPGSEPVPSGEPWLTMKPWFDPLFHTPYRKRPAVGSCSPGSLIGPSNPAPLVCTSCGPVVNSPTYALLPAGLSST